MEPPPPNSTGRLPTPRQLLTILLKTLTSSPSNNIPYNPQPRPHHTQNPTQTTETTQQIDPAPSDPPSNALKSLPAFQKAILSTLHVLFPPPMLLQALDLLDRGLVTRITLSSLLPSHALPSKEPETQDGDAATMMPLPAHLHLTDSANRAGISKEEKKTKMENYVFQVRSSQPVKGRFRDATSSSSVGNIYTVRLEAWNCSCAAFAFSAFPFAASYASTPWSVSEGDEDGHERDEGRGGGEGEDDEWEFGGLCLDGKEGGNVPVCKHLLACLLGEKWALLASYVKRRGVGRDEMAGVGGEG